ncbi:MAG: PQQ-binding-like beta-propeller repeat protein [Thermomicrobiales bacterium]|nr:PQQ-binding-like beta-propeller repeat protein [Thermomicrobiales bacterium]MCO5221626.1 PQQ-binding-like beta-propeller repeat protein [Thermomicrobiales bacterium]
MNRSYVRWRFGVFVAVFVLLSSVLAGVSTIEAQDAGTPVAAALPAVPPEVEQLSGNWPTAQGNLAATRSAVDSSIDSSTVADLDVAWTVDIPVAGFFGAVTANPIVVGDTVFIQDMQSNIYAIDRQSGELKWLTEFGVGSIGPTGLAVAYGMVFAGLSDTGEVVALAASNGEELWRQKIGSPPGEGIDMAPAVYGGYVYISTVPGTGVGPTFYQDGDRGVLYVLDALTGEVAWWFDTTVDGFGVPAQAGGGGLWYPPSFDADGNIYFGVGNPAPWPLTPDCPNGSCRPGDNLFTSSMVSLDPESGGVRWYYQDRPHDLLDLDFQNTPVLGTVTIDGDEVLLAVGSGKTGNVVAANAETGDVIWKTPLGIHQNDENSDLPDEPIEVYPGAYGGVETPMAYANGVFFATWIDLPQYQGATGQDPDRQADFATATGGIVAIDGVTGAVLWETGIPTMVLGGATVANDLVFTAGLDGIVRGFDIATGEEIWSWEAPLGINAPLAIAGDTLYVAPGFVKLPSVGSTPVAESDGEPPSAQLVALRIGGPSEEIEASPSDAGAAESVGTPSVVAEGETSPVAADSDADTSVELVDIRFVPDELTIAADTDFTIALTNTGVAIHNFVIDSLDIHSGDVMPGETVYITINAPAGEYTYYCSVPGHREAGMVGELTVQ